MNYMSAFAYYLFRLFERIIFSIPLVFLYLIADLIFVLLYYFPGYRRKVVALNLRNAFPEKSEKELRIIARKFYRHLADLFIEVLKLNHLSSKELLKRCRIENTELLERLWSEGRDVVAVLGHYNNWEYLTILPSVSRYKFISVYKPLKNKYFDRHMIRLRARHGMILAPMSQVVRQIITFKGMNEKVLVSLLSDQTPARGDIHYWTTFLNQDTPVYLGAEKISSKYDMAVIFFNCQKIKRGYYRTNIELLFEHTKGLPEYEITEAHVRRLDEIIRQKPEFWLWSHHRWKHKRETF